MLQTQPFFIKGIEDADASRTSAFGAMGMFMVAFVASLLGMWYDSQNKIEEETPSGQGGETEYQLAQDTVPTYGTAS